MTLATSGQIAIGGTWTTRSINLELGRSATATSSLGESALRNLANDTSGAISMSTFHGKSAAYTETQTVTVGYFSDTSAYIASDNYGYNSMGSVSDGTFNAISGASIAALQYNTLNVVLFALAGSHASSTAWTQFTVGGQTFTRASSSVAYNSITAETNWSWTSITTNPYGTTTGATKAVVFT